MFIISEIWREINCFPVFFKAGSGTAGACGCVRNGVAILVEGDMMMQAEQDLTAVIWGRKTAVCAGIEECLKRNGWRTVYASAEDGGELVWDLEYDCPDCPLDLLIFGDDSDLFTHTGTIYENQERAAVLGAFDFHVNGALYALHTLLPRLERGKLKRICYVTTKESSNNMCSF